MTPLNYLLETLSTMYKRETPFDPTVTVGEFQEDEAAYPLFLTALVAFEAKYNINIPDDFLDNADWSLVRLVQEMETLPRIQDEMYIAKCFNKIASNFDYNRLFDGTVN